MIRSTILTVAFWAMVSACFAGQIIVPAASMDSCEGNVDPQSNLWDGLAVLHGVKGSEFWKFDVSQPGEYTLYIFYASGETRPAQFDLNGKASFTFPGTATGGFYSRDVKVVSAGSYSLQAGENRLKISVDGNCMPHFQGFVFTESKEAPAADVFVRVQRELAKKQALEREKLAAPNREMVRAKIGTDEVLFIRRHTFPSTHYYTDFIDGCVFFESNLCVLNLKTGAVREILKTNLFPEQLFDPEKQKSCADGQIPGIISRCQLSFDAKKVIFDLKPRPQEGFRIWEVNLDGTGLKQLTFPPDDEQARIAKYQLSWHGRYFHTTDDFHPCYLPDGGFAFVSTRCEHGILCDGPDILTSSVLYRGNRDSETGNTISIEKLSDNSVSESCPAVMNDGRILYTRWEYVDNGSVTNKGLWAVRPDGTMSADVAGRNIAFPSVFYAGRPIPGSSNLFVCLGAPHMPTALGTVMVVDTSRNIRTGECVRYITPEIDVQHQWNWDNIPGGVTCPLPPEQQAGRDGGGNTSRGPLFCDPFPINEKEFLVSYNPDQPWNTMDAYGLYYINDSGQRQPFYQAPGTSCWGVEPVIARTVPPVLDRYLPDQQLAEKGLARLVVTDIYRGMDGVERGSIKWIRINEHVPRPWSARRFWAEDAGFDQQHSCISFNAALGLRVQYGIVPVEADGSAHFVVPADKNIFLQALDANYEEVQRERTFIDYRPGEVRACVGCHEMSKDIPASASKLPLAMTKPAVYPQPQPGDLPAKPVGQNDETNPAIVAGLIPGYRTLSFHRDVQPVLDRHCIRCHGGKTSAKDVAENGTAGPGAKTEPEPKSDFDLTGTETTFFCVSYENLMRWNALPVIGENHPKAGNNHYLPPFSLGAKASKLTEYLNPSHYNVKLTPEERLKVTTWLDANGQYHGTYYGKKNVKYKDEPDYRITDRPAK